MLFSFLHFIRTTLRLIRFVILWKCFPTARRNVARWLPQLGPTWVKWGQALSVRPDIVGQDIAEALSSLQDNLPPFSSLEARRIVERELGKSIADLFHTFEDVPVAAASIAQVHKAVTHDGARVAVKIIRPTIEKQFAADIAFFRLIARWLDQRPRFKRLRLLDVVDTLAASIARELDLRLEAASASALKAQCADDPHFYVPSIYWEYTARRVLTLEWIDGIAIDDVEALCAAKHDTKLLAEHLAIGFFNQAYRHGFFHADTHPGNLFVDRAGRIVPIDFGIMGVLDENTRLYVAEILRGFLMRDYDTVAEVHFAAGYVPAHHSKQEFALACRAIGEPIAGLPVNKISIARLLEQLFAITQLFDMQTQPQLLLLQKTLVLIEGLGARLYPDVNLWSLAEPWITEWAKENLSPKAKMLRAVKCIVTQLKTQLEPRPTAIKTAAIERAENRITLKLMLAILLSVALGIILGNFLSPLLTSLLHSPPPPPPILPFG